MISVNNNAAFTWDTANFCWDDPAAGKTWDTAYTAHYTLAPTEILTVTIADRRTSHITNQETTHLMPTLTRHPICIKTTIIALGEQPEYNTAFNRTTTEPITANETAYRCTELPFDMQIDCTDRTSTNIYQMHHRTVAVSEAHTHRADYRRSAEETAHISTESGRNTARTAHAFLKLTDTHLTPWQGTLSSVTLLADGMDSTAWTRFSNSPSGYEAFHPFDVGEYTYRDALIRLLLTTGAAGADPLLYDVAFHVDIEDTRESGTAECTASEATSITLKHHYYQAPRIVLTVLSADTKDGVPIPHLIGQSETDGMRTFDCELLRPDGTRTNGTVSWLAEGY